MSKIGFKTLNVKIPTMLWKKLKTTCINKEVQLNELVTSLIEKGMSKKIDNAEIEENEMANE